MSEPVAGQLQPLPLWISEALVAERELLRLLGDARVALHACCAECLTLGDAMFAVVDHVDEISGVGGIIEIGEAVAAVIHRFTAVGTDGGVLTQRARSAAGEEAVAIANALVDLVHRYAAVTASAIELRGVLEAAVTPPPTPDPLAVVPSARGQLSVVPPR